MNTFIRWWKFNLVGAIGVAVQLAALALLNRWVRGHYLFASAAAVELALLNNFVWHLHFTWRDRRDRSALVTQLIRFHLSNGLVSMLGNLVLMRILVHEARVPLLVANMIAILCCSVVNFCLGNNWAFAEKARRDFPLSEEQNIFMRGSQLQLIEPDQNETVSTDVCCLGPRYGLSLCHRRSQVNDR